jgi:hypothetical protein
MRSFAGVAQSVEQLIRNEKVGCSIHLSGTKQQKPTPAGLAFCFAQSPKRRGVAGGSACASGLAVAVIFALVRPAVVLRSLKIWRTCLRWRRHKPRTSNQVGQSELGFRFRHTLQVRGKGTVDSGESLLAGFRVGGSERWLFAVKPAAPRLQHFVDSDRYNIFAREVLVWQVNPANSFINADFALRRHLRDVIWGESDIDRFCSGPGLQQIANSAWLGSFLGGAAGAE